RPPAGGYEPTFTAPHRNNDTIRVIKKAPVTEPFPLLRRQGSNLRPPAGGYEPYKEGYFLRTNSLIKALP
ncbi:hypothetical protein, partial [Niastella caeni]|uniref:hypothetical protein n=1 Tax=Niastella caeni TaxID=2569763 RepID=UPI001AA09EF0